MSGWLEIGAACAILSATTTVAPTETGWTEHIRYDLLSSGGCRTLALHIPAGTSWTDLGGKLRLGDGGGGKLIPARFEVVPDGLSGETTVMVHLNDLLSGDGVRLELDQSWTSDESYAWTPSKSPAAWSELRTWKGAQIHSYGDVQVDRKKGEVWIAGATPSDGVELVSGLPESFSRDGQAAVAESGLSLRAALEQMDGLLLQPRAVDGTAVQAGDAAITRGIVDDRGWARTLVALTAGGPDKVELGHLLRRNTTGEIRDALTELAVATDEDGTTPILHPATPTWTGNVQTPSTKQAMAWTQIATAPVQPDLALNRELELIWDGEPQFKLVPGAGSTVRTVDTIEVEADTAATAFLPIPTGAYEITIEGELASLRTSAGLLLSLAQGEKRTITVSHIQDDAPTYGLRATIDGFEVHQQIRVDGKTRWEDDAWRLVGAQGSEILPSREALLRALDWRFTILAYPEPAVPYLLKGRTPSWETATDLPEALRSRVRPAPLNQPPLWPRKLLKARRSGVVTSVEAALFTSQWAKALRMDALLVLVRPAPLGEGPEISPASYDQAVIAIHYEGELRWQDPTCTVCAPYELRPDMEGASAYAWSLHDTRAPTPGSIVATTSGESTSYELAGSAALSLRLALQNGLGPERTVRAANWLAGGGTLTSVEGLAEAGEPVTAVVSAGRPRFWPSRDEDGSTWMGWVGERQWVGAPTGPDSTFETDAIGWSRTTTDGVTTEVLLVKDRRVSGEIRDALAVRREAQDMPLAIPITP